MTSPTKQVLSPRARDACRSVLPLLSAGILFLSLHVYSSHLTRVFGDIISGMAGPPIRVARLSISPVSGIVMREVTFRNNDNVLRIERLEMCYTFSGLFRRQFQFKRIRAEGLDVYKPPQEPDRMVRSLSELFKSRIRSAGEQFPSMFGKTVFLLEGIRIYFHKEQEDGAPVLSLDQIVIRKDQDRYKLRGHIDVSLSETIKSPPVLESLKGRDIDFVFDVAGVYKDLIVHKAKLDLGGRAITATGIVQDIRRKPFVKMHFYTDPFELKDVASAFSLQSAHGSLSVLGELEGTADSLSVNAEAILPSGEMEIEGDKLNLTQGKIRFRYDFWEQRFSLFDGQCLLDNDTRVHFQGEAHRKGGRSAFKITGRMMPVVEKGESEGLLLFAFEGKKDKDGPLISAVDAAFNRGNRQYRVQFPDIRFSQDPYKGAHRSAFVLRASSCRFTETKKERGQSRLVREFSFKNLNGSLKTRGGKLVIPDFRMEGYQGRVVIDGEFYKTQKVMEYDFHVVADKMHLDNLKMVDPLTWQMTGMLSGELRVDHSHGGRLSGILVAEDFRLDQWEVLDALADFLGLEKIRSISQAQIMTEFALTKSIAQISRLDVDSPDILIRSSLTKDEKHWYEGLVALSLPRDILRESPIFRRLMAMAREHNEWLEFVLHVSGYQEALRLELEKSDLRDKLRERLSPRIQRIIVDTVNEAIRDAGP